MYFVSAPAEEGDKTLLALLGLYQSELGDRSDYKAESSLEGNLYADDLTNYGFSFHQGTCV